MEFHLDITAAQDDIDEHPTTLPDWVFYAAPIILITICLAVAMITWAIMR